MECVNEDLSRGTIVKAYRSFNVPNGKQNRRFDVSRKLRFFFFFKKIRTINCFNNNNIENSGMSMSGSRKIFNSNNKCGNPEAVLSTEEFID